MNRWLSIVPCLWRHRFFGTMCSEDYAIAAASGWSEWWQGGLRALVVLKAVNKYDNQVVLQNQRQELKQTSFVDLDCISNDIASQVCGASTGSTRMRWGLRAWEKLRCNIHHHPSFFKTYELLKISGSTFDLVNRWDTYFAPRATLVDRPSRHLVKVAFSCPLVRL